MKIKPLEWIKKTRHTYKGSFFTEYSVDNEFKYLIRYTEWNPDPNAYVHWLGKHRQLPEFEPYYLVYHGNIKCSTLEEAQNIYWERHCATIRSMVDEDDSFFHVTGERITRKDLNNAYREGFDQGKLYKDVVEDLFEAGYKNPAEHDLYKTGDLDAPDVIKDSNGEVVLGLCKKCGKAEIELSQPCISEDFD